MGTEERDGTPPGGMPELPPSGPLAPRAGNRASGNPVEAFLTAPPSTTVEPPAPQTPVPPPTQASSQVKAGSQPSQAGSPQRGTLRVLAVVFAAIVCVAFAGALAVAVWPSDTTAVTSEQATTNPVPSAALPGGWFDQIQYDTEAYIRLGGADTSTYKMEISPPRRLAGFDSDYAMRVSMELVDSTADGPVTLPALVGNRAERWRVSWGGVAWPPADDCLGQGDFVAFPDDPVLDVGETVTGSLCLRAFLGSGSSTSNVVFDTAFGPVVFTEEGRRANQDELDRSLSGLNVDRSVAPADRDGLVFGDDASVVLDFNERDRWEISVGTPQGAEQAVLGDASLASEDSVMMTFPVSATLSWTSFGPRRLQMDAWIIGGHSGVRYPVSFGWSSCDPDVQEREISWVPLRHTSRHLGCSVIAGVDAASIDTVFVMAGHRDELVVFELGEQPSLRAETASSSEVSSVPTGTPIEVQESVGAENGSWRIETVAVVSSDEPSSNEIYASVSAEPGAVDELGDRPFKFYVVSDKTQQVYGGSCTEGQTSVADSEPALINQLCVLVPASDADPADHRYVLQVGFDFHIFSPE